MVTHVAFRAGQTSQAAWNLAQVSTAAPVAVEVLCVWLYSPEGGLEYTKENGKKPASIMK